MLVDHSFLHRYFRYRLTVIVMSGSTDFPYLSMSIGRYSPMFYSVHTAICSILVPMCAITLTTQPSAQCWYIYLPLLWPYSRLHKAGTSICLTLVKTAKLAILFRIFLASTKRDYFNEKIFVLIFVVSCWFLYMPPPSVIHVGTVILWKGFDNVNYFRNGTGEQSLVGFKFARQKSFEKKKKGIQMMIRFRERE